MGDQERTGVAPDDAGTGFDAFRQMHTLARSSDVGRQGENEHIEALFRKAAALLKRLDRLMENYKETHSVGYAKYRAAHTTFDYGGRKSDADTDAEGTSGAGTASVPDAEAKAPTGSAPGTGGSKRAAGKKKRSARQAEKEPAGKAPAAVEQAGSELAHSKVADGDVAKAVKVS